MKNVSFKENPITTVLGVIATLIGLMLFTIPYFMELKEEVQWYIPTGAFAVGILLLLSPDTLLNIIKSKSEKI